MSSKYTYSREYYFEHPEVMRDFSKSDWCVFLDDNVDFDLTGQYTVMSDVEFNENIEFIEKCGGKLFVYYYLLGANKERLPENVLNYLKSLNESLKDDDIQLLNAINVSSHFGFDCLALELEYFYSHVVRSLNKYGVKRICLYNNKSSDLIGTIKDLEDDNWKVIGTTISDDGWNKGIVGLEFKKVEKEND